MACNALPTQSIAVAFPSGIPGAHRHSCVNCMAIYMGVEAGGRRSWTCSPCVSAVKASNVYECELTSLKKIAPPPWRARQRSDGCCFDGGCTRRRNPLTRKRSRRRHHKLEVGRKPYKVDSFAMALHCFHWRKMSFIVPVTRNLNPLLYHHCIYVFTRMPSCILNHCGKLYKVSYSDRHFVDDRAVELFDVSQDSDIFQGDEVDSNTLSAEPTTSTDSVQISFTIRAAGR